MKKILCGLLALVMVLSLFACGGKTDTANETKAAADTDSAASAEYVFLDETLGVETYAIGFRMEDQELADMVSGAVKALVVNGTFDEIASKEAYADIKPFLCLKAEDFADEKLPERGSGDPNFTFKQGYDQDYPPYAYMQDDGTYGGFDIDVCKAVCEYLGWGYEGVPFNWDYKDVELNAKSCDCIWSGMTKEGREDKYAWGITYSNNTQAILVAADSDIKTLDDLSGKLVGVQIGTSAAEMLDGDQAELAATFAELKTYETYNIAFNDLKAGAIDAIAIDMTIGAHLISSAA